MSLEGRTCNCCVLIPTSPRWNFAQRFVATISADASRIEGQWETSYDQGETWQLDFPLSHTRVQGERDT